MTKIELLRIKIKAKCIKTNGIEYLSWRQDIPCSPKSLIYFLLLVVIIIEYVFNIYYLSIKMWLIYMFCGFGFMSFRFWTID